MARKTPAEKPTHRATGKTFDFDCTPVASHLNHDGKANGITRVVRSDGKVTDVGTKTLTER
jgi:hypothetical protein